MSFPFIGKCFMYIFILYFSTDLFFVCHNFRIEFGQIAATTKSLNLGQGFPDYDPPSQFSKHLSDVTCEKNSFFNQYTRGFVNNKKHTALVHIIISIKLFCL